MKILQINQTYQLGSTGKIMSDLNDVIIQNGHEGYMLCAYALKEADNLYVMDKKCFPMNSKINILKMRITGINGYSKKKETIKALKWVDTIRPDIIHLHNIHGDWINLEILFNYLKIKKIAVVWTLHDCWAFTGRCSHFELCGCRKWKTGCYKCKNLKAYPISYILDFSKKMWKDKKNYFTGIENLRIVTPSKWLANYVQSSFLGKYNRNIIHNGIDLSIFKPVTKKNKYLKECEKKIILGVASSWSNTKGYNDFLELDKMIDHDKYQIVMVGLNKRQIDNIPKSIIGIERTFNISELVNLYSNADVFLNLTYQDNYPTINLEAISCGVPVITYRTGGSPESVSKICGFVVEQGDLKRVVELINMECWNKFDRDILRSIAIENFGKEKCFEQYLELYYEMEMRKVYEKIY